MAGLEEELGSRSTAAAGAAGSASEAVARAEAAEARCRQLEAEADNLGKQVALLQERLGRGEYNAATTRVLHFKYNPEVGTGGGVAAAVAAVRVPVVVSCGAEIGGGLWGRDWWGKRQS